MSKTAYTEEEIQQILHNLFIEKKKVKELQQQLRELPEREFQPRRDGQQEILQRKLEEVQQEALNYKQSLAEALEKLTETHKDEPTAIREYREQMARQKQSLEKVTAQLKDKERKIQELQQFEYSYKKGNELKQQLQRDLEELNAKWRSVEEDKQKLEKQIEENTQHIQQLERAVRFLREKAEAGELETNQLQAKFQEALNKIDSLSEELSSEKKNHEEMASRLSLEQTGRQEAEEELKLLYGQFDILKARVAEIQQTLAYRDEALLETNQIIERLKEERHQADSQHAKEVEILNQKIELHFKEKQQLEEELHSGYSDRNEQEQRLKVAQQHLGKKVKETTLMTEQLEEQKKHVQDLEQNLAHATGKIHDMQNALENQSQHEKRLQEQLNESLKSIESQMAKWEAKYFSVYEKWQETEFRNKELKGFEEKYHQLQSLLSNVGNFVGIAQGPMIHSPVPQKTPHRIMEEVSVKEEPLPEQRRTTQNLFEVPQHHVKAKNSLFE